MLKCCGSKGDQRHRAQGDLRLGRQDATGYEVAQADDGRAQDDREEPKRGQIAGAQLEDRRRQQIVERRMVIFILNGFELVEMLGRESGGC